MAVWHTRSDLLPWPLCTRVLPHMSLICHPERVVSSTAQREDSEEAEGKHLLIPLQSEQQLLTFCLHQDLQGGGMTLQTERDRDRGREEKSGEGGEKKWREREWMVNTKEQ